MKFTRLFPLAAALMLSLPMATWAQQPVVEPPPAVPTPPLPPDAPETPEAAEAPEIPELPEPPETFYMEMDVDAMIPPGVMENVEKIVEDVVEDIVIEAPDGTFGVNPDDIHIDVPQLVKEIQIDSLRNRINVRITRDKEDARLRRDTERLSRDLARKARELERLKIRMKGDTAGLADGLATARQSLDSARRAMMQLRTELRMKNGNGEVAFRFPEGEEMGNLENFMMITHGDSTHPNIMITRKMIRNGDGEKFVTQFFNDTTFVSSHGRVFTRLHCDSVAGIRRGQHGAVAMGGNFMMTVQGDSSHVSIISNGGACGSATSMVKHFTRVERNGANAQVLVLSGVSEDSVTQHITRLAPLSVLNNRILIGKDSVRIIDGSDQQMAIRVQTDTTVGDGQTRVVVLVMSRSKEKNKETEPSVMTEEEVALKSTTTDAASAGYALEANKPNPFNDRTNISFTTPKEGHANLSVFDANGTLVKVLADEVLPAGSHSYDFLTGDLPSGIYLYRLVAGGFSETKTMTIAK